MPPVPHTADLLRHLRKLIARPADDAPDGQLLEAFAVRRDGDAFAALVRRHGPMVLHVCRSVLRHAQDAEDAFQAAFLVLARKAASIRQHSSLAGWLHAVAYHVAVKARAGAARRQAREVRVPPMVPNDPLLDLTVRELHEALHEELNRLPEKYRAPLLLCYLEGKTQDEAARLLGWTKWRVKGRLERGRAQLRTRLVRRGLGLSAAAWALAPLALPAALANTTARVALAFVTGTVSGSAATALAELALRGLALAKVKAATVLLLAAGLVAGALLAGVGSTERPQAIATAIPRPDEPQVEAPVPVRADRFGDPLPPGALARMGTLRWRLESPFAYGAAFTADGTTIVTADGARTLLHWDVAIGKLLRRIPGDPALLKDVEQWDLAHTFSADGRTAAIGGRDGLVRVVDTLTGKERARCRGHEGLVHSCALSADGRVLVTRSIDQSLRVWDTEAGRQLRQLTAPTSTQPKGEMQTDSVALAPDGRTLAWPGYKDDSAIHVCDAATGQERHRLEDKGRLPKRVAFSPDGRLLAATMQSPNVGSRLILWEVTTGRQVRALEERNGEIFYLLRFAPDGKSLVTCGSDSSTVWDVATGTERWRTPIRPHSAVSTLAFSPDGKALAIMEWSNPTIHRFDVASGGSLATEAAHHSRVTTVAFVTDGEAVVTRGNDETLRWWQARTGRPLRQISRPVYDLVVSPDQRVLAVCHKDTVAILDATTGDERWRQTAHREGVARVAFSPDGRVLATTGADASNPPTHSIALWDVATGKELRRIPTEGESLHWGLAFASNGQSLLGVALGPRTRPNRFQTFFNNSRIDWWDTATGRQTRSVGVPPGHSPRSSLAFSPDGRTLLLHQGGTSTLSCVEVATGQFRCQIRAPVSDGPIGFSPDSRILFTGGADNKVRAWDVFSGRLLLEKSGHNGYLTAVGFSPDGRRLATGSLDTTALVWDMAALFPDRRPKPAALTREELDSLWIDLAGDAAKAYQAIGRLVASPDGAVSFLSERLRHPPASPQTVERLIADLDSANFAVRQRATYELEKLGESAAPALHKALAGRPSAEVRRRVEELLEKLDPTRTPERLRELRAVEVLEHVGSEKARRVLRTVAESVPESALAREAKGALDRLAHRPARP